MIYIITPVFNRKDFTKNYLSALSRQTSKNFKIIIVDDGSSDGTSEMIEEEFPEVLLLKEKGDLWWAEATNIGIKRAISLGAKYVMTLNDDTLPFPDFIEKMNYWLERKPSALLGALAVDNATGNALFAGEILNWNNEISEFALDKVDKEFRNGIHEINIFPGRGFLIPTSVFEDIGFYDSRNFPQTMADLDFSIRATNFGYKTYCNYDAKIKIFHEESGGMKLLNEKSWKNYYEHLFGMKGGANLRWFTIFVFKNAPKRHLFQYWFKGMVRRVGGYLLQWLRGK
ncbi:glycosyltransferase family 2 protein [Thalassotalea psychrophila]|uniref:Glycosyltransferase family 2 protein n=1 Tax=Thalassotalea psychrophila TaxID=3065647 RepID=A0ABY9TRX9_9GAMM|nr:glycosyltransferase family 2 protein [Colwelliaceae bacterium SQ149]